MAISAVKMPLLIRAQQSFAVAQKAERVLMLMTLTAVLLLLVATFASAARAADPGVPSLPASGPLAKVGCQAGQTDFNRASQAEISAVFRAIFDDSMPSVAKRVVEGRKPWYLDIEDLKTINGIGPAASRH